MLRFEIPVTFRVERTTFERAFPAPMMSVAYRVLKFETEATFRVVL